MKRINFIFVSICVISLISTVLSDENCELYHEDGQIFSDFNEWLFGIELPTIEDTAKPGTKLVKYKHKNIDYIENPDNKYLYLHRDTNFFYIELNDNFAEYEEHETSTEIKLTVTFRCLNGQSRDLKFTLAIKDTNNHAPEFLNTPYKLKLPMPIPTGYDLEPFVKIVARDIDLTNKQVTFSFKKDDVNNYGFSIQASGKQDKNYPAKLTTSSIVDLENDVTLVLYATDSGVPPLTSNTTISITVNKEDSIPRFSHALYTANLSNINYDEVDEVEVNFSQGLIILERGFKGVKLEIRGVAEEFMKHFELTHSGILRREDNVELQLKLVDLSEEFLSQGVLTLIVAAVKDRTTAETVLQIILPEVDSNNSTEQEPICEELTDTENDSTNGYMIATIILSITTVGLLGYVIYLFIYRNN